MKKLSSFTSSDIANSFGNSANSYDRHAIVQHEIGSRLLKRLNFLPIKPKTIVDIGSGTGTITSKLQKFYPKAKITGIDLAHGMNCYSSRAGQFGLFANKPKYLTANTNALPFKDNSFDLLFSNLTLTWCLPPSATFKEWLRVTKPNGAIFFSTFGPDTLKELRQSWQQADNLAHLSDFYDMQDVLKCHGPCEEVQS